MSEEAVLYNLVRNQRKILRALFVHFEDTDAGVDDLIRTTDAMLRTLKRIKECQSKILAP